MADSTGSVDAPRRLSASSWFKAKASKVVATFSEGAKQIQLIGQQAKEATGLATKTVDEDLDAHLKRFSQMQKDLGSFTHIMKMTAMNLLAFSHSQSSLGSALLELTSAIPELSTELMLNKTLQDSMSKNGSALMTAMTNFTNNINQFSSGDLKKIFTLQKVYDQKRLEYDIDRLALEKEKVVKEEKHSPERVALLEERFAGSCQVLQDLKKQLQATISDLDKYKMILFREQLVLLQKAFSYYLAGNDVELSNVIQLLPTNSHVSFSSADAFHSSDDSSTCSTIQPNTDNSLIFNISSSSSASDLNVAVALSESEG